MNLFSRLFLSFFLLISLTLMASCSSDKDKDKVQAPQPLDKAYADAMASLNKFAYKEAAEKFEKIEEDQPYSKWAAEAQIMAAYSHYRNEKYDDAVAILDQFIKLHPGHKHIDYVYYLKAMCYYNQITDVKRDQKVSEQALAALNEVIARFPDTVYARDAKIKVDLVYDHLAGKEMEIGRFYLNKGKVIAAIGRFQMVVERYQTTTQTPEALYRLTASYLMLGVRDEATKYASVLGQNYPSSKWYKYSYDLLQGKSAPLLLPTPSVFAKIKDTFSKTNDTLANPPVQASPTQGDK